MLRISDFIIWNPDFRLFLKHIIAKKCVQVSDDKNIWNLDDDESGFRRNLERQQSTFMCFLALIPNYASRDNNHVSLFLFGNQVNNRQGFLFSLENLAKKPQV